MRSKKFLSFVLATAFLYSLCALSACGGSKGGYSKSKVHSGSGMGNKKDKNKHVWGK